MPKRAYWILAGTLTASLGLILLALRLVKDVGFVTRRPWMPWLLLALFSAATLFLWFRLRHSAELRPWLARKLLGNAVLAAGVLTMQILDLPFEFYLLVLALAFSFWISAYRKLRLAAESQSRQVGHT
jgi:hypothetical protein